MGLHKGDVRLSGHSSLSALRLLQTPIQRHLPTDAICYRLSPGGREAKLMDIVQSRNSKQIAVFALSISGSVSNVDPALAADYATDVISICAWEMTTTAICQRICHEYEQYWRVCIPGPLEEILSP